MPMYDFACASETCGHEFEDIIPVGGPAPACPECGGVSEMRLSAPLVGAGKIAHMSKKGRQYLSPEFQAKQKKAQEAAGLRTTPPKKIIK